MPILQWIGKEKVVNHHLKVPYHVLERKYSYDEKGQQEGDNGSENMIIHGDNLLALKSLLPKYEGKVKCIYIDPPYNTGNEGWVYNDNVNDPQIKKWLGEVVGKEGEDLSRHDKWLCMMYPRLRLLQKLLADDGAIFISIDDNEQAYLKLICDEIFGKTCFKADVIWRSSDNSNNNAEVFSEDYNHTLVYSKKSGWRPNKLNDESKRKHFKNPDNDPRGPWFDGNPVNNPGWRPNLQFDIIAPNGNIIHHPQNGWRWSMETIKAKMKTGEIRFSDDQTRIIRRTYLNEMEGLTPSNLWIDLDKTAHTRRAKYDLKKIFPEVKVTDLFSTPKPSELIKYIIQLVTKPNDIILDSFAGSGTTAHAVLKQNQEDGGHRKFILIEMMDYADSITAERVKRVIQGYGEGKKAVPGTGGDFSYYELGAPLMKDGFLNESVGEDVIRQYVYFMDTKENQVTEKADEPYFLGKHLETAYYFYYKKEETTVLSYDFLSTVKTKAEAYVMYADQCLLSGAELMKYHITFKKIPRDIARL